MRNHRWILGAWAGAAWLLSFAAAEAPSPSPRPSPRKVFSDDDLKKYQSPSPSPAPSPAPGATGTAARPTSPGAGGTGSGTGARPYRRKPQVNVDPGARRKNESQTEPDREAETSDETRASRPSREDDDEPPEVDPRAQQEAAWRARADQARTGLNRARGAVTSAEDEVSSIAQRLLMSTDSNEILRLRSAQVGAEEKLAQARLAQSGAELALTNLEEDARRNNIPPGWIRER